MKKYPHAVVSVFIKHKDGKIALFRSPQWPGLWIPPGGHIEYCERMEDAAKREAKEELGASIYDLRIVNVIEMIKNRINPNLPHLVSIHFLCKIKNNKFILDDKEIIEYKWFSLDEALSLRDITKTTRETLKKIKNEKNLN